MATTKKTTESSRKKTVIREDEVLASEDVQVKGIVSNISMLYNTIRELRERSDFQKIEKINFAQEENFARLKSLDEEIANKMIKKYRTNNKGILVSRAKDSKEEKTNTSVNDVEEINQTDVFLELFNRTMAEKTEEEKDEIYDDSVGKTVDTVQTESFDNIGDIDEIYDVINLPSNGQCYPHKKKKIAVSFLTATDENFITSPNLYRDGLIIDCLLNRKVVDKSFDIDSLCAGDVDAITFFLRVSSYGPDFPATFTDPESNESFDTVIDLNQIKVKPFNLVGDENGWFDFELPVTKDKIKFRFLTKKDERKLEKLNQLGSNAVRATELKSIITYLENFLEDGTNKVDDDTRYQIEDGMAAIEQVAKDIQDKEGLPINKLITNRMEMMVMSVNGNTDKKYIRKYVRNMVAKDSITLRRYILDNTPGLDFSIKVERPESLGGGSIDSFLEWSDTVFLSIT